MQIYHDDITKNQTMHNLIHSIRLLLLIKVWLLLLLFIFVVIIIKLFLRFGLTICKNKVFVSNIVFNKNFISTLLY